MPEYNNKAKRDEDQYTEGSVYTPDSDIYHDIIRAMGRVGYAILPDAFGRFGCHEVYKLKSLVFNPSVKVWLKLGVNDDAEFDRALNFYVNKNVQDYDTDSRKVFINMTKGLTVASGNRNNPFVALGARSHGKSVKLRSCTGQVAFSALPQLSWFPHLTELDPLRLLALMPEAEAELLMLTMGKMLWGNDNVTMMEGNISHGMRSAIMLYGKDADTGKSYLMKQVMSTLELLGYSTTLMPEAFGRFGMGQIAQADFSFADDTNKKALKGVLNNASLKSIVTGNPVKTEDKGIKAEDTKSTTTLFFCTNDYNKELFYDLDNGVLSRYKFLKTYTHAELADKYKDFKGQTFDNWDGLCKQYKVTVQDLACYLLAHSAERFLKTSGHELIDEQVVKKGVDNLKDRVDELTEMLVLQVNVAHLEDMAKSIGKLTALAIANARFTKEELEETLGGLESVDFGYRMLGAAMQAYVAGGGKDKSEYLLQLANDCYTPIKNNQERWSNYNTRLSNSEAFEAQIKMLTSKDGYGYAKNPGRYANFWDEVKVEIPKMVETYLHTKPLVSKELKQTLNVILALITE